MTKNEIQALSHYTCEYPEDMEFDDVLGLIEDGSDDVTIWEPFEYYEGRQIVELINDMVTSLDDTYGGG